MNIRLVVVRRLVLILLMAALPRAILAQSDAEPGEAFLPLVFGDHAFSMLYPAAWIFNTELQDAFHFASQASLFDTTAEPVFETGDVRVSLSLIPSSSAYDPDTPLLSAFAQVIDTALLRPFDGEFPTTLFPSLPELMPIPDGTTEVARLGLDFGADAAGRLYFWQLTDHVYGLMNVTAAAGELDDHEAAVLIMIESATLTIDYTAESLAASAGQ